MTSLEQNRATRTAWRNRDPMRRARAEIARQWAIACEVGPSGAYDQIRLCWSILRRHTEKPVGWAVVRVSDLYSLENAIEVTDPFYEAVVPVFPSHRIQEQKEQSK